MKRLLVFAALASVGTWAASLPVKELDLTWGGRKEHPAVVNPVLENESGSVLSLRGEWEFTVQSGGRNNMSKSRHFYRIKLWPCAQTLRVPGCWEAQGVGKLGMSECWDFLGDQNAKPIRHKYMGNGWCRKTVTIPAAWKGKRVWLKVGGVKSVGWFWVNDRQGVRTWICARASRLPSLLARRRCQTARGPRTRAPCAASPSCCRTTWPMRSRLRPARRSCLGSLKV